MLQLCQQQDTIQRGSSVNKQRLKKKGAISDHVMMSKDYSKLTVEAELSNLVWCTEHWEYYFLFLVFISYCCQRRKS